MHPAPDLVGRPVGAVADLAAVAEVVTVADPVVAGAAADLAVGDKKKASGASV